MKTTGERKFFTFVALAFLVPFLFVAPGVAQNLGTVGISAKLTQLYSGQTGSVCSKIVSDIGQGSNIVFVAQTSVGGGSALVDIEWSPTNSATGPFFVITQVLYGDFAAASHVLTVNGYFPNMRSCMVYTSGTWSSWYTAVSGALSYASPGVGTFGPTSPPVCDQWTTAQVTTGSTGFIGPSPQAGTSDQVIICGISVSFNGATAAGSLSFIWSGSGGCAAPTQAYLDYTTANTPQNYNISTPFRSFVGVGSIRNFLCVNNTSGATAGLLVNWMSLHTF